MLLTSEDLRPCLILNKVKVEVCGAEAGGTDGRPSLYYPSATLPVLQVRVAFNANVRPWKSGYSEESGGSVSYLSPMGHQHTASQSGGLPMCRAPVWKEGRKEGGVHSRRGYQGT